jgi:nondiscriminating aspartyl-tRNA synthetase
VFERVYETGPVFRAEPHDTARHLAEYVSLDAEAGFIGDHRDVLAVLRHALAGMTAAIGAQAQEAAGRFGVTVPEVPAQIPVIHFCDALKLVGAPEDQPDLAPAHGMPPHGGFAIGLERWTARLTQADNIREVTLFPRDLHRLTP